MIESLSIENFRCFLNFKADGFEQINLIGGKNNSGKTCLLEAIAMLTNKFNYGAVSDLRGENINNTINNKAISNQLKIIANFNSLKEAFIIDLDSAKHFSGIVSAGNIEATFISQKGVLPDVNILQFFDELDSKLGKDPLMEILKILDTRIEDMRTFKSKEGLHIRCKNDEYRPLSSFGDATNSIIKYFTPVFEKELYSWKSHKPSVLLIDEIENGLHYSIHYDFWEKIFLLSKRLNVQVFATTHSLEMIKAFSEIANKNGNGAYFEMGIDIDTGEIFAEKHDAEQLNAELLNPHSTVRGE